MPYIGKQPVVGNFQVCDAISVVNGQAAYTMQVASTNVSPESAFHMLVSLNGVLQKPGSSFTISGSTITFASNLATGDVIDFIILLGDVLNIGAPSDDTVATASIKANAVTGAKLNTDVISAQTALGAEPADTDEFLVSDAGVLKRVDYSYIKGGGITMADNWRVTTSFTGNADPISSNWERNDTAPSLSYLGSQMTESSGVFTFPSTGIYLIIHEQNYKHNSFTNYLSAFIQATTDNSTYVTISEANQAIETGTGMAYAANTITALVDITDTTNQKVRFKVDKQNTSAENLANSARDTLAARFIRLADT
jgi:hypothetical protein